MTIQEKKTYYTGRGITGYVTNGKLGTVDIIEIRGMKQLEESIDTLKNLYRCLTQDGVK
jgi:hypothetical protein